MIKVKVTEKYSERVTEQQLNLYAKSVLDAVAKAFERPEVQEKYKKWLKDRGLNNE